MCFSGWPRRPCCAPQYCVPPSQPEPPETWAPHNLRRPQVLQRASVARISPFLDPSRDVVLSLEQTRHRLLVLSCLCPGAATLVANLLRFSGCAEQEECVGGGVGVRAALGK